MRAQALSGELISFSLLATRVLAQNSDRQDKIRLGVQGLLWKVYNELHSEVKDPTTELPKKFFTEVVFKTNITPELPLEG